MSECIIVSQPTGPGAHKVLGDDLCRRDEKPSEHDVVPGQSSEQVYVYGRRKKLVAPFIMIKQ